MCFTVWKSRDGKLSITSEFGRLLSVDLSPMPNPHNHDYYSFSIDAVYHAIVADANPKMVRLSLELLAARRKRVFAERVHFLADAPLKLLVEVPELSCGRRREFEDVAHRR